MPRRLLAVLAIVSLTTLAACSGASPDSTDANQASSPTIVIGSQDYYSNEIVAEIYAQALENAGFKVDRQFRIGQREVYLPEIEQGKIDLFPEYSGPLLQYLDPETTAKLPEPVYSELAGVMPAGLRVLDQSPATDQDSYVVTEALAPRVSGSVTLARSSMVVRPHWAANASVTT